MHFRWIVYYDLEKRCIDIFSFLTTEEPISSKLKSFFVKYNPEEYLKNLYSTLQTSIINFVFRGSQKLLSRRETEVLSEKILEEEQKTVQGALETALNFTVKPANKANLYLSSR